MRLRLVSYLAGLLASFFLAGAAMAAGSIFVVRGVDVEATGESGPKACEAAYGQGQDRAWTMLIKRIVPEADWGRVPTPSPEQLTEMVSGYEVSGEKRSNVKCVATMTYLFKGDLVKKYLRALGLSYADRRGPSTLALPLYETPEGTRLWGDDNLWLNAFRVVKLENELIPVEAPYGDDGDKAAIPPGVSLGTDWLTYKTIADKYGMKAVLVARATFAAGTVTVEADLVSENGAEHFSTSATGADERGALANAVRSLAAVMGENWKRVAAIDNSISAGLTVWAPYSSLAQRNEIEARLRKIQNILDVAISRVTTTGMSVYLRYRGRNDQFEQALRQAGFGIYPASTTGGGLVLDKYRPGVPMSFGGPPPAEGEEPATPAPPPAEEPPVEEPQVIRPQ